MKLEKSETLKLKFCALRWLRLEQRCAFIATEVGSFSADVLGINEKKMVEVEVKISREDLLRDFQKHKHRVYTEGEGGLYGAYQTRWIPNSFYFAVPGDLVEACKAVLEKKQATKYGIISLEGFSVIKRAQRLHDREPDSHAKFVTALRMGSELIRFHEAWV